MGIFSARQHVLANGRTASRDSGAGTIEPAEHPDGAPLFGQNRGAPNRDFALAHYRRVASRYDAACRRIERKRRRTLELLALRPGEAVIDVGCGTGSMLEALSRQVGPSGRVIGIEQSPEMIALAHRRAQELGLRNVSLLEASAEDARVVGPVDALLFCYTHDVLRSRAALGNLFAAARAGTRVAACGAMLNPRWLAPLNLWLRWRAYGFMSTVEGLQSPWSVLAEFCPDFAVRTRYLVGSGYAGSGRFAAPTAPHGSG